MPPDDDDLDLTGVDTLDPADLSQGPTDDQDDEGTELDTPDDQDGEGDDEQSGDQPDDIAARDGGQDQRQQQPSRSNRRIQELNRRLREAEERDRERGRQIDELIRARSAPARQDQGESEAQRAARLAALSPEERLREELRESQRQTHSMIQQTQFQQWDSSDRALFETKAQIDPTYKRWKDRVEKEIETLRSRGQSGVAREAVLYYLLGKAFVERKGSGGNRQQRRAAETRLRGNTTRVSDTRSNAAPNRRSAGRSPEERLADIPL